MASSVSMIQGNQSDTDNEVGWYSTSSGIINPKYGDVGYFIQDNNSSGFNAIPEGFINGGYPSTPGYNANFWTSTYGQNGNANYIKISHNNMSMIKSILMSRANGLSVRFVRDAD